MADVFEELKGTRVEMPYRPEHVVWPASRGMVEHWLKTYGVEEFNRRMGVRNERIHMEETDPFHYCYEPATWKLADVLLRLISLEAFLECEEVPERWKTNADLMKAIETAIERKLDRLLINGGNRAAKTVWLCRRMVQHLWNHPNYAGWLMHETWDDSVETHQAFVWQYFPNEWKHLGKSNDSHDPTYIAYKKQNGWSQNRVTCPNGAYLRFRFYGQDEDSLEGSEVGAPDKTPCIGVGTDEMVTLNIVKTLGFRCTVREAGLVNLFTPKWGYNDVVAQYREHCQPVYLEFSTALRRNEPLPLVELGKTAKNRGIVYFHNHYNKYGNWPGLLKEVEGETDAVRKIRCYGYAERETGAAFARFDERVHVVKPEVIFKEVGPDRREGWQFAGTNWMGLDPAGSTTKQSSKNWFMLWVRCTPDGRLYVYREWPNQVLYTPGVGVMGPWAEPGQQRSANKGARHVFDGVPGSGAVSLGLAIPDYKEFIAHWEGWPDARDGIKPVLDWEEWREPTDPAAHFERVYGRVIDSRYSNTGAQTHIGHTTLLDELNLAGISFEPAFTQEGGKTIKEHTALLDTLLKWTPEEDPERKRKCLWEPGKGPRLFISEDCQNLIFAMKKWTGMDGQSGATKDPIDVLRYLVASGACHVEQSNRQWRAGGVAKSQEVRSLKEILAPRRSRGMGY